MLAWAQSCAPRRCRVHSGSRVFTHTQILIAVFIRVRVGSLGRDMGRRDHSGFTLASIRVIGLIRVRVGSLSRAQR